MLVRKFTTKSSGQSFVTIRGFVTVFLFYSTYILVPLQSTYRWNTSYKRTVMCFWFVWSHQISRVVSLRIISNRIVSENLCIIIKISYQQLYFSKCLLFIKWNPIQYTNCIYPRGYQKLSPKKNAEKRSISGFWTYWAVNHSARQTVWGKLSPGSTGELPSLQNTEHLSSLFCS